jgi:VCBS repeat-containing protein
MSKQIQYAGYSIVKDGTWKFRTATDAKRIDQLEAFGESVYMVSIRPVDSKSAAAKELLAMDYMGKDPECVAFFVRHARDDNPFAKPKNAKTVTLKKSELTDDTEKLTAGQRAKLRAEFNERVRVAYEAN